MSQIIDTSLGRFRCVINGDGEERFLWECPNCKQWFTLSDDQWNGRVSVACDCTGMPTRYHETHEYGKALVAAITAARLTDSPVWHEDEPL